MESEKLIFALDQIDTIADQLWTISHAMNVYTFIGALGAGKTTLIKALLQQAGIKDLVTSPTFTIVNEYKNDQGQRFFHFDLYRMKSLNEFVQGGFNEYLYVPNSWCFIEWPQIIESLLTHNVVNVNLEIISDETRALSYLIKK